VSAVALFAVSNKGVKYDVKPDTTIGRLTDWLLNGDGTGYLIDEEREKDTKLEEYVADSNKLVYPLNFAMATSLNTNRYDEIENYFTELNKRYDELKADQTMVNKKDDIEKLGNVLTLLEYNVNYAKKMREIFAGYDENGVCREEGCFTKYFDKDLGDEELNKIYEKQEEFYRDSMWEMSVYVSSGCADEAAIGNYNCVVNLEDGQYLDELNEALDCTSDDFDEIATKDTLLAINKNIISLVKKINEV
jgi:hypothetical protein